MRVFAYYLWWIGEVDWSGKQMRSLYYFRRTLTLSTAEIVFNNHILLTLFLVLCSVAVRASCARNWLPNSDIYGGCNIPSLLQAGDSKPGT